MGVFYRFDREVELDDICITDLHDENLLAEDEEESSNRE